MLASVIIADAPLASIPPLAVSIAYPADDSRNLGDVAFPGSASGGTQS